MAGPAITETPEARPQAKDKASRQKGLSDCILSASVCFKPGGMERCSCKPLPGSRVRSSACAGGKSDVPRGQARACSLAKLDTMNSHGVTCCMAARTPVQARGLRDACEGPSWPDRLKRRLGHRASIHRCLMLRLTCDSLAAGTARLWLEHGRGYFVKAGRGSRGWLRL